VVSQIDIHLQFISIDIDYRLTTPGISDYGGITPKEGLQKTTGHKFENKFQDPP